MLWLVNGKSARIDCRSVSAVALPVSTECRWSGMLRMVKGGSGYCTLLLWRRQLVRWNLVWLFNGKCSDSYSTICSDVCPVPVLIVQLICSEGTSMRLAFVTHLWCQWMLAECVITCCQLLMGSATLGGRLMKFGPCSIGRHGRLILAANGGLEYSNEVSNVD